MTKEELKEIENGWNQETIQAIHEGIKKNNLLLEDLDDLWITDTQEFIEEFYSNVGFNNEYIKKFIKEEDLIRDLLSDQTHYKYNENDLIIFYLK